MQQIVQFACTQTRLAHPDLLNKLNHPIRLALFAISSSIALVVSLSTDALYTLLHLTLGQFGMGGVNLIQEGTR